MLTGEPADGGTISRVREDGKSSLVRILGRRGFAMLGFKLGDGGIRNGLWPGMKL
jgi:hypothetical protein